MLEAIVIVLLLFALVLVIAYHRRTVEKLGAEIETRARTLLEE